MCCFTLRYIIYALFLFVSIIADPLVFTAVYAANPSAAESESPKSESPGFDNPSIDDHGFMFPLEDLVETPDKSNDRFYVEFLNMLATLGLVIAIILIAAWFLRRILNTRLEQINTTSTIKVIEKRALSPKSAVYLLEIYDKVIAIAETQNGITQLGEFTIPSESEVTKENIPSSFVKILEKK